MERSIRGKPHAVPDDRDRSGGNGLVGRFLDKTEADTANAVGRASTGTLVFLVSRLRSVLTACSRARLRNRAANVSERLVLPFGFDGVDPNLLQNLAGLRQRLFARGKLVGAEDIGENFGIGLPV